MKDIKVGVKKMTRNRRKMIEKTADSLLLSKHSIQFSALFLLLSDCYLHLRVWSEKTLFNQDIFYDSTVNKQYVKKEVKR